MLLHPTSLPGAHGIGEFNDQAYAFVDFLAETGQKLWQVLPLGPTGYGDSPYQCFSAFAGNPLLISLDHLIRENALLPEDLADPEWLPEDGFAADRVNYGDVIPYKAEMLRRSYVRFINHAAPENQTAFEMFCAREAAWLDDYALFMALKDSHEGEPWNSWEDDIARRTVRAMAKARKDLKEEIQSHKYQQYQFFKQWGWLKEYAAESGAVYLDYYSALAEGRNLKKEFTNDGLLLNDAGYAVLAPLAEQAIVQALGKQ